jgi:hypothetical protein
MKQLKRVSTVYYLSPVDDLRTNVEVSSKKRVNALLTLDFGLMPPCNHSGDGIFIKPHGKQRGPQVVGTLAIQLGRGEGAAIITGGCSFDAFSESGVCRSRSATLRSWQLPTNVNQETKMISRVQRQYFNMNLLHTVKPASEAAPQNDIDRRTRAIGGTEVS